MYCFRPACRYQVRFDDSLDNTIVVDGVPVIDKSKVDKLLAKISREFGRKGALIKPSDIFLPWDDSTDKSKGFVFVDFPTVDEAIFALNIMNGHHFDARHQFKTNRFSDIERYENIDATYVPPVPETYRPRVSLARGSWCQR